MPSTPYAKLLASLNGGAAQDGGITAANGDTVQFTAESTAQWELTTPPRWEIYAYPPGWTGPASGWTTESVASPFGGTMDVYVYLGLGPPPSFTLPALPMWGDFLCKLTVAGGLLNGLPASQLIDNLTALRIVGPGGLTDIAVGAENQFSSGGAWVESWQNVLRILDAAIVAGSTPYTLTPEPVGTTGSDGVVLQFSKGDHVHELSFTTTNAVLATADAAITVNGQTVTSGGFIAPYFSDNTFAPADAGVVRVGTRTNAVVFRNELNDGNIVAVSMDDSGVDDLIFGSSAAASNTLSVGGGNQIRLNSGGTFLRFTTSGGIAFGDTATAAISQSTGGGAGADMTISAQSGGGVSDGGDLILRSGAPGVGASPGDVVVDVDDGATTSGRFFINGGVFSTLMTVQYDSVTSFTTIGISPDDAFIDAKELVIKATNAALFATTNGLYGGGVGVLYMPNATTAPTADIASGIGVYTSSDALRARNHALTVLAPDVENAPGGEDLRAPDRRASRTTTADATVTTAYTYAIPDAAVAFFVTKVVVFCPTDGTSAAYEIRACVKRFGGGVATLVGSVDVLAWEDAPGLDATLDVDGGNNARIRVTGIAATTFEWLVTPDVTLMQPAS
jgi:hypothetical protein